MPALSITRPDDWHVHFRDGDVLANTVHATAMHFGRALVMPNLHPALTTITALRAYYARIMAVLPPVLQDFQPYMTLYLNEQVTPETFEHAKQFSPLVGAKLYPAGATTNSADGVASLRTVYPLLAIMQENNLVLQIHGEVTHGDIFEREAAFIRDYLAPLVHDFPRLRIVLEHISTQAAVEFVTQAPDTVAATITPHHLLYNRNQLLVNGVRPHYYCLPILKHARHQQALQHAAVSGNPKFFAGTDSAPHAIVHKESACGCAGIYSAPYALAIYAQIFDACGQLDKLGPFMSHFGADFYGLPRNQKRIALIKQPQRVPDRLAFGDTYVVPIAAGETLSWSMYHDA